MERVQKKGGLCGCRAQDHLRAEMEQRLLGAGGLWGTVLEVVMAVGAEAGKGTHILHKVHLAILVGVQKTHELIVVTLPKLRLLGEGMRLRVGGRWKRAKHLTHTHTASLLQLLDDPIPTHSPSESQSQPTGPDNSPSPILLLSHLLRARHGS